MAELVRLREFCAASYGRARESNVLNALNSFKYSTIKLIESAEKFCDQFFKFRVGEAPYFNVIERDCIWGRATDNGVPQAFYDLERLTLAAINQMAKFCIAGISDNSLTILKNSRVENSVSGRMDSSDVDVDFYNLRHGIIERL